MIEPRLLTRPALRRYLGDLPWSMVVNLMQRGKLPQPLYKVDPVDKTARWDRKAVDRALDAESGIPTLLESQVRELDKALGFA